MTLHSPFLIGPRLLPALRIGDVWISMECVGVVRDKIAWRYYIDGPDWRYEEADIYGPRKTQAAFVCLLSFLGACAAGRKYQTYTRRRSENADLFPDNVGEWAEANSDEIDSLRCEIEESTKTLIED